MKLFLVTRSDKWDFDEYDAAVVSAADDLDARAVVFEALVNESRHISFWPEPVEKAIVRVISDYSNEDRGVVLSSFHAG